DLDGGCTPEESLARCDQARLPRPTAVVHSGHGVHLYWRLAEPFLITDAGDPPAIFKHFVTDERGKTPCPPYSLGAAARQRDCNVDYEPGRQGDRIVDVVDAVQRAIGGDSTRDLARLLRLPGTWNRKNERNGQLPVRCEVVDCDPARRYALADFERIATT